MTKVMGLASYGEPKYLEKMGQIVRLNSRGKFSLNLDYFISKRVDAAPSYIFCEKRVTKEFMSKATLYVIPAQSGIGRRIAAKPQ